MEEKDKYKRKLEEGRTSENEKGNGKRNERREENINKKRLMEEGTTK